MVAKQYNFRLRWSISESLYLLHNLRQIYPIAHFRFPRYTVLAVTDEMEIPVSQPVRDGTVWSTQNSINTPKSVSKFPHQIHFLLYVDYFHFLNRMSSFCSIFPVDLVQKAASFFFFFWIPVFNFCLLFLFNLFKQIKKKFSSGYF